MRPNRRWVYPDVEHWRTGASGGRVLLGNSRLLVYLKVLVGWRMRKTNCHAQGELMRSQLGRENAWWLFRFVDYLSLLVVESPSV